jgi:two-component system sensor histidine kinase AlgZ
VTSNEFPTPISSPAQAGDDRFYLPNLCTTQSLLFIVLTGTLLSIVFTLVHTGIEGFNWQSFSLIALFILWIVLVCVGLLCKLRPYLTRLDLMRGSLVSYMLVLCVTLLISLLSQLLLAKVFLQPGGFHGLMVIQHVLIAAILAGVCLRYLYLQEQLHVQQRAELSSRIQALQSRIRPHFLFNSMNIIASLIETDPQLAEQVVEDLSSLFRASLSEANHLVPVEQEIELGKNYLHIESLRLGERLHINWEIDEELINNHDIVLPHLSLQPLLENAVYHGIQPLAEGGTISIQLRQQDREIYIKVCNPVSPDLQASSHIKGNQLALENLRHRLQVYYSNMATLTAGRVNNHFEVCIQCPVSPPQISAI